MKYKHKRTGNLYEVLSFNAEVKELEWQKCVVYMAISGVKGKLFVRKVQDFENKFEKVPE